MLVMRFQPNGQPDTTFGNGGRVVVNMGGATCVSALALQPDGRIVLVGTAAPAHRGHRRGPPPKRLVRRVRRRRCRRCRRRPIGRGARCAGKRATVIGTAGRDRLKGTRKADVIAGLGGNDAINGLAGNDIVWAAPARTS